MLKYISDWMARIDVASDCAYHYDLVIIAVALVAAIVLSISIVCGGGKK